MPRPRQRIDRLALAVPGLTELEARRLGEEVSRRLAERLGEDGARGRWDSLQLAVDVPRGTPHHRLAALIAEQILGQIANRTAHPGAGRAAGR